MAGGRELEIYVDADGGLQMVYSDELAAVFADEPFVSTRRASHVEPVGHGWIADMRPVGGPVLWDTSTANPLGRVPFATRQAALAAERAWLDAALAVRRVEAR